MLWLCRGDKGSKDALRDLDFSRAHKDRVLVSACEDGSCSLWETETGDCLTTLELPAGAAQLPSQQKPARSFAGHATSLHGSRLLIRDG